MVLDQQTEADQQTRTPDVLRAFADARRLIDEHGPIPTRVRVTSAVRAAIMRATASAPTALAATGPTPLAGSIPLVVDDTVPPPGYVIDYPDHGYRVDDFDFSYQRHMILAYPSIAGMTSDEEFMATPAEKRTAFGRILSASNLRAVHDTYLRGQR